MGSLRKVNVALYLYKFDEFKIVEYCLQILMRE